MYIFSNLKNDCQGKAKCVIVYTTYQIGLKYHEIHCKILRKPKTRDKERIYHPKGLNYSTKAHLVVDRRSVVKMKLKMDRGYNAF